MASVRVEIDFGNREIGLTEYVQESWDGADKASVRNALDALVVKAKSAAGIDEGEEE